MRHRDPLFLIYSLTAITVAAFLIADLPILSLMFAVQALVGLLVLGRSALWRLGALVAAALGVALVNALAASDIEAGLVAAMRVLAVVTGGALLFPTVDATRLADALGQRWHLPHRFVLGALVALRQVETFRHDMQSISLARRIQGVAATGVMGRLMEFPTLMFTFLVSALRQGSRISLAMQSRGLSASARTWSRPARPTGADWLMLGGVLSFALICWMGAGR